MTTPICDFVNRYVGSDALRLHMPGHKGRGPLGVENLDITEIPGADSLYEAGGIIRESEQNASCIFGCPTYFSTEGSSQCIRAMLHLAMLHAGKQGKAPRIAAGRNAHRAFLSAAALLDADIVWLYPERGGSYLSCAVSPAALDAMLEHDSITAVYITSPDYLGLSADIQSLAEVCHRRGALLLVDCAHGAYLRFLQQSLHPMDLGADMCCASAHKTLPVVTGGAYLHVRSSFEERTVKNALALFGSTSPSYLILQSLDAANTALDTCCESFALFAQQVSELKRCLAERGWQLYGDEPLKLTLCPKPMGYTGTELSALLVQKGLVCEFSDPDNLVMMLTPAIGREGLERISCALSKIPARDPVLEAAPVFAPCEQVMPLRSAMLSCAELVPAALAEGRVLASPCVGCPPAVPIVISGQRISADAVVAFRYYGITHCEVCGI